MAKMMVDIICRITVTYACIVGTIISLAALVYLFIYHDGGASVAMATVGAGLILGRVITDKLANGKVIDGIGGGKPDVQK